MIRKVLAGLSLELVLFVQAHEATTKENSRLSTHTSLDKS